MKRIIIIFFSLIIMNGNAQDLPYELLAPDVVAVNRMPMRAHAFRFENKKLARPMEEYRILFARHSYSCYIRPVK